jgi:hypothetical protein
MLPDYLLLKNIFTRQERQPPKPDERCPKSRLQNTHCHAAPFLDNALAPI